MKMPLEEIAYLGPKASYTHQVRPVSLRVSDCLCTTSDKKKENPRFATLIATSLNAKHESKGEGEGKKKKDDEQLID